MRKSLERPYTFVRELGETLISMISIPLLGRIRKNNLASLKKRLEDKDRLVILCNGPSLKNDLQNNFQYFQSAENVMVVNEFFNSDILVSLKPTFSIAIDPSTYRDKNGGLLDLYIDAYNSIDWDLYILVPNEFKNSYVHKRLKNDKIHPIYLNIAYAEGFKSFRHTVYRLNLGMPRVMNVLNAAIFSAINLGFKEVEVYGADHSWTIDLRVNSKNQTCVRDGHFFDEENHLRVMQGFDMESILATWSNVFRIYKLLNVYAKSRGTTIINCTPSSFIDAFPRK